ncbi:Protein abhd12b [Blomia tropicalis]|nr:Protein abhd12b [Blomia tropicalis]
MSTSTTTTRINVNRNNLRMGSIRNNNNQHGSTSFQSQLNHNNNNNYQQQNQPSTSKLRNVQQTQQQAKPRTAFRQSCKQCGATFNDYFLLVEHLQLHATTELKPYQCMWPKCTYACSTRSNAIKHVRSKHFHLPVTLIKQRERGIVDNRDPNDFIRDNGNETQPIPKWEPPPVQPRGRMMQMPSPSQSSNGFSKSQENGKSYHQQQQQQPSTSNVTITPINRHMSYMSNCRWRKIVPKASPVPSKPRLDLKQPQQQQIPQQNQSPGPMVGPNGRLMKIYRRSYDGPQPFRCTWPKCGFASAKRGNAIIHVRMRHFGLPRTLREQLERGIREPRDPATFIVESKDELYRQKRMRMDASSMESEPSKQLQREKWQAIVQKQNVPIRCEVYDPKMVNQQKSKTMLNSSARQQSSESTNSQQKKQINKLIIVKHFHIPRTNRFKHKRQSKENRNAERYVRVLTDLLDKEKKELESWYQRRRSRTLLDSGSSSSQQQQQQQPQPQRSQPAHQQGTSLLRTTKNSNGIKIKNEIENLNEGDEEEIGQPDDEEDEMNESMNQPNRARPYFCKWPDCDYVSNYSGNVIKHVRKLHLGLPKTMKTQRKMNLSGDGLENEAYKYLGKWNPEKERMMNEMMTKQTDSMQRNWNQRIQTMEKRNQTTIHTTVEIDDETCHTTKCWLNVVLKEIIRFVFPLTILWAMSPFIFWLMPPLQRRLIYPGRFRQLCRPIPSIFLQTGESLRVSNGPDTELGVWHIPPQQDFYNGLYDYSAPRFNDNRKIVLYAHANSGDRSLPEELYGVLSIKLNYHVVTFDYRGYGDSWSRNQSANAPNIISDLNAVYQWILEHGIESKRIILWGHCLGSSVVVHLLSTLDDDSYPFAAILEAAFTSLHEELYEFPLAKLFIYHPFFECCVVEPVISNTKLNLDTISLLPKVRCPLLILHAVDDKIVPFWMGEQLFKIAQSVQPATIRNKSRMEQFGIERKCGHTKIQRDKRLPEIIFKFVRSLHQIYKMIIIIVHELMKSFGSLLLSNTFEHKTVLRSCRWRMAINGSKWNQTPLLPFRDAQH